MPIESIEVRGLRPYRGPINDVVVQDGNMRSAVNQVQDVFCRLMEVATAANVTLPAYLGPTLWALAEASSLLEKAAWEIHVEHGLH